MGENGKMGSGTIFRDLKKVRMLYASMRSRLLNPDISYIGKL